MMFLILYWDSFSPCIHNRVPCANFWDSSKKLIEVFILLISVVIDEFFFWDIWTCKVDDLWVPGYKAPFHWDIHWVSISYIEKELKSTSCCSEIVENDNRLTAVVWIKPLESGICYDRYCAYSKSILVCSSCFAASCRTCKPDNVGDVFWCGPKALCK